DGTADIGVGTSRAIESKIREQRLFSDRLAVFCNTDHAFAERQRVRWMDLQGQKLVGFASDNPIQAIINRVLDENQIVTERAFSVNFSTTMLALIDLGQGICIAPEHSLRLSVPGGTLVRPLVEPELRRDVVASTLREHTLSTSASSLLDTLISTATSKYR
ncbi:MAG: LysR substrate-binding domain-containing protein, partial [bacterium]